MTYHLSILLWIPAVCGVIGLAGGRLVARVMAVVGSVLPLAFAIGLVADFHPHQGLQHVTDDMWIKALGVHYKLGVDGLNLFLILLATILVLASTIWMLTQRQEKEPALFFYLGLGHTGLLGALLSQDLALFVAFFDLMLIPFFFITGVWGDNDRRVQAVTKLFIYTLVGSLLMLTAAVATGVLSAAQHDATISFAFSDLRANPLSKGSQEWVFLCFSAAFLVKMPAFPFHGWMPDGYRAMPLPALAVFSGVVSKVAAYGFLRVAIPLFPQAAVHFQDLLLILALASILYGSALAFSTTNARLILGYSSIAQLGFITLGIFSLRDTGAQGALLQAFNHGLVVAPAFVITALLARRAGGSEDIRDMGGLAFRAPVLWTLFLIVALANLAIPGSSNFVGEFLILLGVFNSAIVICIVAFTGVALAAVYSLRLLITTMHNRRGQNAESRDISLRDGIVLVPLVAAILAIALYPQLALHRSQRATRAAIHAARSIDRQSATTEASAP